MKPIIISVVLLVITLLFSYGVLAFAEWSIDPFTWEPGTRVVFSVMASIVFIVWITTLVNILLEISCAKNTKQE